MKWIKFIFYGIEYGCTFFVFFFLISEWTGNTSAIDAISQNFTIHALGTILVGMGYGTTPIVYTFKKIPWALQVFIHFAVGMSIFYTVGIYLHWFRFTGSIQVLVSILISIIIFFVIWSVFYLYHRNEAKKMNRRLRELEGEDSNEVADD